MIQSRSGQLGTTFNLSLAVPFEDVPTFKHLKVLQGFRNAVEGLKRRIKEEVITFAAAESETC